MSDLKKSALYLTTKVTSVSTSENKIAFEEPIEALCR